MSESMSAVFYRFPDVQYSIAENGSGMYLYDRAGRAYLDMSGGAAVSCLGHGNHEIIAAVQQQLRKMSFAHTAFFTNEPQEKLAALLQGRFLEGQSRIYFTSGGSEAIEAALKFTWQYWHAVGRPQKKIVMSRRFSYHGNTLGALSVSGSRHRRYGLEGLLHDWPRVAPCYEYRHRNPEEEIADYGRRAAADLERAIVTVGSENIAAFILEPVSGASLGAVPPVEGYLREIRRICTQSEILLICDEVMCGSGRTGTFFAHEQDGIVPDIVTLAKGLSGGYQPLGATLVRNFIWEAIRSGAWQFVHGHTYVGHAVACAAGVAVQEQIDKHELLSKVSDMGAQLMRRLRHEIAAHPAVGDVRGRGLLVGVELVADKNTKRPFPDSARLARNLRMSAVKAGLICYPGSGSVDGELGTHILLAPPFILESRHLDELIPKLLAVIEDAIPHPAGRLATRYRR